jgi:hypothetical protein
MATIAAIVEDRKVEELTKLFLANHWGDQYSLVTSEATGKDRIVAAPAYGVGSGSSPIAGVVFDSDAADDDVGVFPVTDAVEDTSQFLIANLKERLDDFDLSHDAREFFARRVADGATFVALKVDDDEAAHAQELFAQVDAQHVETVR